MIEFYAVRKPSVAAYIVFGSKERGFCKELSLTLQKRLSRVPSQSNVVRFIRPVNGQARRPGDLPGR